MTGLRELSINIIEVLTDILLSILCRFNNMIIVPTNFYSIELLSILHLTELIDTETAIYGVLYTPALHE